MTKRVLNYIVNIIYLELVRIPTQELDKTWGLVDKDIRQALAYSSQLTDSDFVFETAKQDKFQVWIIWDKNQKKQ